MFVLEQGVQTVSCAPYSHSSVEPAVATSRIEAQEICAKVLNQLFSLTLISEFRRIRRVQRTTGSTQPLRETSPTSSGLYILYFVVCADGLHWYRVYACTAMHEVHSGVAGWELGVRGELLTFVSLFAC